MADSRTLLFAASIVTALTACGGGGGSGGTSLPVASPMPSSTSAPPPSLPPPPLAPVATVPYLLPGTAGPSRNPLLVVDPAQPTAPREVDVPGTLVASVFDMTSADPAGRAYERFRLYDWGNQLWRVDLARSSDQTPAAMGAQRESASEALCYPTVALFPSRPTESSQLIYRSAGPDGKCFTSDYVYRALRVDAPAHQQPTVVDGTVLGAIHDASGAIDGWIVRKGVQILRQSPSFDAAVPVVLATLDQASDQVQWVGSGQEDRRFILLASRTDSSSPSRLLAINATAGTSKWLDTFPVIGDVRSIGADRTHLYFMSDGWAYIRRIETTGESPSELVVHDPTWSWQARLARDRIVYDSYDWDAFRSVKSIPKTALNVLADDPTTGPLPTTLVSSSSVSVGKWNAGSTSIWFTGWDYGAAVTTTKIVSDDGGKTLLSVVGQKAGEMVGTGGDIAGLLVADNTTSTSVLRLYNLSDGSVKATYGALPAGIGGNFVGADTMLLSPDSPGLVSVIARFTQVVDLYFINGTNPGITRVTKNIAPTNAPVPGIPGP